MAKQYYIEYYQVGNNIKVSAIDPETATEASIFGPANANIEHLKNLAVKKLEYMLNKGNNNSDYGQLS